MTDATNDERIRRWAEDPLLLLVSRWVAIGGIPAIAGLCWAMLTWGANIEARLSSLADEVRRDRDRITQIDERLRVREANAFTETDATLLLETIRRELDQMNRNLDNLRDDVRATRGTAPQ